MLGSGQIDFNRAYGSPSKMQDQVEDAHNELIKEVIKDEEKAQQKLDSLIDRSQKVLLKISSVFPFTLFPHQLSIDINQVNIRLGQFFWTDRRQSINIKDIGDVIIDTVPFFATIKIIDKDYVENLIEINFLKKRDAIKARKVIQGLMVAAKEEVDLSLVDDRDLLDKIETLGKIKQVE